MSRRPSFAPTWLVLSLCLSSCYIRVPRQWQVLNPVVPAEPYIDITVRKEGLPLPIPPVLWFAGTTKEYMLDIMVHMAPLDYQRLDSIAYEIRGEEQQVVAAGTLPLLGGEFSFRAYDPTRYQAQSATKHRVKLGKHRQNLTGTFTLYLTDKQQKVRQLPLQKVPLKYTKARFGFII